MGLLYIRLKRYTTSALARYSGIVDLEAEQSRLWDAKRLLIHACAFNLGLVTRKHCGSGNRLYHHRHRGEEIVRRRTWDN